MKPFVLSFILAATGLPTMSGAATLNRIVADLDALATFTLGSSPTISDFDEASVLINGLRSVEAFVPAGLDFETAPTPDGPGFGSAAVDAFGNVGVGVNSFFLGTVGDPPARTSASAFYQEDILNDSDEAVTLGASLFIPAPTVRVGGQIGNGFPSPRPAEDPTAEASARLFSHITRLDGTVEDTLVLDYGIRLERIDNIFTPVLSRDARGLTGDVFSFQLAAFEGSFDALATLAPGESVAFDFQYFAEGTNGFGETGFFAAIGDPFDITGGGGRFDVTFADDGVIPEPSPVPLPAGLPLLAVGLGALALARKRHSA